MKDALRTAFAAAILAGAMAAPAFAAPDNTASPPPAMTNDTSAAQANAGQGVPNNNQALQDTTTGGTTMTDDSNVQASNHTAMRHSNVQSAAAHAQTSAEANGNQ